MSHPSCRRSHLSSHQVSHGRPLRNHSEHSVSDQAKAKCKSTMDHIIIDLGRHLRITQLPLERSMTSLEGGQALLHATQKDIQQVASDTSTGSDPIYSQCLGCANRSRLTKACASCFFCAACVCVFLLSYTCSSICSLDRPCHLGLHKAIPKIPKIYGKWTCLETGGPNFIHRVTGLLLFVYICAHVVS